MVNLILLKIWNEVKLEEGKAVYGRCEGENWMMKTVH